MKAWKTFRRHMLGLPGLAGTLAMLAVLALAIWLRQSNFSSDFIFFCYLQSVGTLLAFTYAANALVRFRGTHDRLTLMLAFAFALAGLIETFAIFGFYAQGNAAGQSSQLAMSWMVGRTLLAALTFASLMFGRSVPHSRPPHREMIVVLVAVGVVAYMTSATYLGASVKPLIYSAAMIARPWELLPAALFLAAAIGFGRRARVHSTPFDRSLHVALWINVGCHLAMAQSARLFDAPFTLAQILKVTSYALVLGGGLLDNARLFDHVRHLAGSDSLTGLGNYRTFVHVMESEIQRSERTGRPFALVLLDLDGLKQINDNHGHLIGSRAICRLGNVLRASSRLMDTAARYGGDEFALVLPEATARAAQMVGRRICKRLASDGETPHVSVSVGTAVYPHDGVTMEELLGAADRALYGMKRQDKRVLSIARVSACS